jgi:hypothetical protein
LYARLLAAAGRARPAGRSPQIANGSASTPGTLHTIVMQAGAVFVVGIVQ